VSANEMVVLFDTVDASRRAEKALEAAGFADPDVNTLDAAAVAKNAGKANAGPGLWKRLFGQEVKLYEGAAYDKALAKGGAILTVRIKNDSDAKKAEEVLAKQNPVDLEARGAGIVAEHKALGDVKESVLRLAEEELEVGKRTVAAGKTRVRRYVTEREVQEKINLTEVHAEVLRKAVDQPVADDWDWSDSTIEVIETREEAVVSKTAHVAEEIRLKTEETERTETVKETVRKQHAEVEHLDADGRPIK